MGFSAVSLFSGCGGFCEGVELAGFDVKVAVEWDRFACETYRHNFPKIPLFCGDVHDFLQGSGSEHRAKYKLDKVDLVFGGPPCQGYSQIGPRDLFDDRNELYLQYARVVRTLKPRAFLMENVPNLLLMEKGHFRDAILQHFASIGYENTTYLKVSAADFGVPQTRERVFFFGTRDGLRLPFDLRELATAVIESMRVKKPVTVAEAIGDLPDDVVHSGHTMVYPTVRKPTAYMREMRVDGVGAIYSKAMKRKRGLAPNDDVLLHNHHTKEIQERRKALIALLAPGAKADSLPKQVWDGARPEKWRRLHPDLPSYTILAQMHRDLSEWVHPRLQRWITVREAARLQSFHDGFVFKSSEWQMLKQIGNAVPPLLAHAMAKMMRGVLDAVDGRRVPAAKNVQLMLAIAPETTKLRNKRALSVRAEPSKSNRQGRVQRRVVA
ncbi:DNA cytosine methyltransferase [Bradyrhizobium sp. BEA-2-5]|uniref:DNA cytosine methyltransferase n=1 Tax=Bradyrhizobium sp. BEA-2-5 TaxID=3080015 RepID=UPI00293E3ADF|nr:DNA cytosine methyltransferase [Bradyrhizobium sp. BEA-2-5]WOH82124.1 DNA cytosine methyltransferase [Bradyrhizobium sp. BEA-2-5]